ncbi:SRPBCC family protein [Acaryochloris sp. CCMEE 5410]|uniref:SRPBCC family protein n=1 Tax=Acaryochloris sp. CCMEE 5410 TaxID=310037 RepID=UPI0002484BC4|nr:SRPBCC family protein [Acaryochloris sp. CCMEE 5410]KAI9130340.1 SRPBCC family protein [Acaryochloris sp. CCMEE 5410]
MHHVHVKIVIRADQQTVFQAISDHEKFLNRPEVKCQLIQEGFDSINGCGAIREVTLSWGTFQEEVTVFQAPNHFEYKIRSFSNAQGESGPFWHDRGWLDFSSENEGTQIDWHTRFEIPSPMGQSIIEWLAGWRTQRMFMKLLHQVKTKLENSLTVDTISC